MASNKESLFQHIPKVDRLLDDPRVNTPDKRYPHALVVDQVRAHLDCIRDDLERGAITELPGYDAIVEGIVARVSEGLSPGIERCVNGAGIILHTSLGRAPLSRVARTALLQAVDHYCTLQINRETGKRGDRYASVERLLKKLTGAEAAVVVNNNAGATLLILNTLAEGKDVIISRGELVEIGGSFRIPDIMRRSGARLVEVGTTNRTHLKDYRAAVTATTGVIMKVHSNYRIIGFTKDVPIAELAALGHELNIPVVDDIGSGALVDLSRWGLPREPMAQESVAAGADRLLQRRQTSRGTAVRHHSRPEGTYRENQSEPADPGAAVRQVDVRRPGSDHSALPRSGKASPGARSVATSHNDHGRDPEKG